MKGPRPLLQPPDQGRGADSAPFFARDPRRAAADVRQLVALGDRVTGPSGLFEAPLQGSDRDPEDLRGSRFIPMHVGEDSLDILGLELRQRRPH